MAQVPEILVHKITLMAYQLNPHPTAQVIDGTLKTDHNITFKQFKSFLNNIINKGYFDFDRDFESGVLDYNVLVELIDYIVIKYLNPSSIFNNLKYTDILKMIELNNHYETTGWRCSDWMGDSIDCDDPVITYCMYYIFNKIEDSDNYKLIYPDMF